MKTIHSSVFRMACYTAHNFLAKPTCHIKRRKVQNVTNLQPLRHPFEMFPGHKYQGLESTFRSDKPKNDDTGQDYVQGLEFCSERPYFSVILGSVLAEIFHNPYSILRVEFLLKTDSGYSKDKGVTLFTLATPGNPPRQNTP